MEVFINVHVTIIKLSLFKNICKKCIFHNFRTVIMKVDNLFEHGLYHYIVKKCSFAVVCMTITGISDGDNQNKSYATTAECAFTTVVYPRCIIVCKL